MIHDSRVRVLNDGPVSREGRFILYWMQQSQRSRFNHALEYAIRQGNVLGLPVVVAFGLMDDYPEANERHFAFMLEGLADLSRQLERRGVHFVIQRGPPQEVALHYGRDAALLVCDRGYLRHQRRWRDQVADGARCRVVQVESDVVVPVEVASDKAEFAARTIRPKIHRQLKQFLQPLEPTSVNNPSLRARLTGNIDPADIDATLAVLKIDRSVSRIECFKGGETEARRRLDQFVRDKLDRYEQDRNEPSVDATSMLSAYLHFGQISPLEVALAAKGNACFLEELIVRRELAMNYAQFQPAYDSYDGLPAWARRTLRVHRKDPRPVVYARDQLECAKTHDRYWNAAQTQMTKTGHMHNYMRMYWGKKVLEWSGTPEKAYQMVLSLNNKYLLDGRGPNSYAGVAWIFGLHDRPWAQRPIFGQVRYMNAAGLERKLDMEAYLRTVAEGASLG